MAARWAFDGRHDRKPYYRCNTHRLRPERCPNAHTVPLRPLDADVLLTLREDVLTPARVERIVERALALHTAAPADTVAQRQAVLGSLATLDRELAQLIRAPAAAGAANPALVGALRPRQ